MLLPNQLEQMKFGVKGIPSAMIHTGASYEVDPYGSYGRVDGTPRVQGHNDVDPDCVPTGYCNAIVAAAWRAGKRIAIADDVPVSIYKLFDPTLTTGMNPEDLWAWGMQHAVQGWQLRSWRRIDHTDENAVRGTVEARGFVPLTIALSLDQQNQRLWTPTQGAEGTPGTWGYHCAGIDSFSGAVSMGTSWGEEAAIDRSYFDCPGYILAAYDLDLVAV